MCCGRYEASFVAILQSSLLRFDAFYLSDVFLSRWCHPSTDAVVGVLANATTPAHEPFDSSFMSCLLRWFPMLFGCATRFTPRTRRLRSLVCISLALNVHRRPTAARQDGLMLIASNFLRQCSHEATCSTVPLVAPFLVLARQGCDAFVQQCLPWIGLHGRYVAYAHVDGQNADSCAQAAVDVRSASFSHVCLGTASRVTLCVNLRSEFLYYAAEEL